MFFSHVLYVAIPETINFLIIISFLTEFVIKRIVRSYELIKVLFLCQTGEELTKYTSSYFFS